MDQLSSLILLIVVCVLLGAIITMSIFIFIERKDNSNFPENNQDIIDFKNDEIFLFTEEHDHINKY